MARLKPHSGKLTSVSVTVKRLFDWLFLNNKASKVVQITLEQTETYLMGGFNFRLARLTRGTLNIQVTVTLLAVKCFSRVYWLSGYT